METLSYTSKEIKIKNTIFSVLIVQDRNTLKYISIKKETNSPFNTLGKQFASFDDAVKNYKNPQMKVELLMIESTL